jgi:hypothetical protein
MGRWAVLLVPLILLTGCSSGRDEVRGACSASQLGVFAVTQGGGGAMIGDFQLRNNAAEACRLRRAPSLSMLDGAGDALPVRIVRSSAPGTMRVRPHQAVHVPFRWQNWCRASFPVQVTMKLEVLQGAEAIKTRAEVGRPRCDEPKAPSTLSVGALQG